LEALVARLEALVKEQAAVITSQAAEIERLRAGRGPGKTPQNSSLPPSSAVPPNRNGAPTGRPRGARRGHAGRGRRRCQPDRVLERRPERCTGCGEDLMGVPGHVQGRSQQVELPPLAPVVVEVVRYACRCPGCGTKNVAAYPAGWDPRQWFGPRLQAILAYLHHHQHVGYERLAQLARDLFGLSISAGALANLLSRVAGQLKGAYAALRDQVRGSPVVGSDETRARVAGNNTWNWVVQSPTAAYHWVGNSRGTAELTQFFAGVCPQVQECDCFSAQLASPVELKQVCMAHQLRDLEHAVEHGDTAYAPRMRRLIRLAIRLQNRRGALSISLYRHQASRLQRLAHALGWGSLALNPFGEAQQQRYRRLERYWWVFLERDDVAPTNNASERALRPVVVHRKVTGGFRTQWGAEGYARFVSVVQTAQKQGRDAFTGLLEILMPHGDAVGLASSPSG
jgi:transposase